MTSTDMQQAGPSFTDEQLAAFSFDNAASMLQEAGASISNADDYGTGFKVCEKKNELLGVPFVIVKADVHDGDYGDFWTLHVVTKDNKKMIINDGGTGIARQCSELTQRRGTVVGLVFEDGLRASDYDYIDPQTQKKTPATTHYLSY